MNKQFFSLLFASLVALELGAQAERAESFDSVTVTTHIYATKAGESLGLDLYRPAPDDRPSRVTVLYLHGGGFAGGRRGSEDIVRFARIMATRGYVVASMSYRLTMRGQSFSCDQPAPNKIRTFQLVAEDIREATLFLLRNAGGWGVDPRKLVLAGSSAGAEAVLHAAYWGDDDLLPTAPPLPADFRYGGVISMAGALVDTSLITRSNAIPTQLFHGTCDPLVPYATAPHHYCSPADPGYLILHGAQSIAEQLERLGASAYLLTECNAGHEWAGRPLMKEIDSISDFLHHDVFLLENRNIHRWYRKEGSCDKGTVPVVCKEK